MTDEFEISGQCCRCLAENVKLDTIIMLEEPAPDPDKGWMCLTCGAQGGAQAICCTQCGDELADLAAAGEEDDDIKLACLGYPIESGRIPVAELGPGKIKHNMSKHPERLVEGGQ